VARSHSLLAFFIHSSSFFNIQSLSESVRQPLFLSINIQSLLSKHEQLQEFISELSNSNLVVDVIAVQEIWDIRYPELVNIPGFKPLIYKARRNMRGGGVGFFVRENLECIIIENLSPFINKIFESITIQLTYPASNKSMLLTCAYRSNGVITGVTQAQQIDQFFEIFGDLVLRLQQTNKESFIFIDANINLIDLANQDSQTYLNLLFAAGYLQGIFKATRIQNQSKSLIDHIHFNKVDNGIVSGVIISDISDHFFTFLCLESNCPKSTSHKYTVSRDFSLANLNNFKLALGATNWNSVYEANDADSSYDCFWSIYNNLYTTHFPLKRKRINKNFNPLNKFMTQGLLISRRTKNNLHSLAVSDPSPANITRYKNYKSVYQRVIRAAKNATFRKKLLRTQLIQKKPGKL
jgi:hypothetical protein